jgi:predicted  nucleic acid-binding Zn-ribbon protein
MTLQIGLVLATLVIAVGLFDTRTSSTSSERRITMSERDTYIARMKSQLDDINAGISDLEKMADTAKGDAKKRYEQELDKLRKQSDEFRSKLDKLKNASEDQWEKMKGEVEKVSDDFKHAYNYFKSQL